MQEGRGPLPSSAHIPACCDPNYETHLSTSVAQGRVAARIQLVPSNELSESRTCWPRRKHMGPPPLAIRLQQRAHMQFLVFFFSQMSLHVSGKGVTSEISLLFL